jgi:polyisoprenoid-binding protein YceI
VHGKSKGLEGRARIRQSTDGLVIERLEAVLPVRTLNTGLGLRDEHMRKYVFTTADGKLPDVRFVAERASCSGTGGSYLCKVSGDLIIRDIPRRFTIDLKVADDGKSLRAAGDGVVRLSTYAISAPSQLGVTTSDDVDLHMDFVVKRVDEQVARGSR